MGMKGGSEEEGKVDRRATCFCDTSLGTGPNDYRQLRQITIIANICYLSRTKKIPDCILNRK